MTIVIQPWTTQLPKPFSLYHHQGFRYKLLDDGTHLKLTGAVQLGQLLNSQWISSSGKNFVLFLIIFDYCDDWGHWLLVIIGVPPKVSLGTLVLCSTGLCHLTASINWFKTSKKEQVRLTSLFSFIQVAWWPHQVTITYAATSLYSILNMRH